MGDLIRPGFGGPRGGMKHWPPWMPTIEQEHAMIYFAPGDKPPKTDQEKNYRRYRQRMKYLQVKLKW